MNIFRLHNKPTELHGYNSVYVMPNEDEDIVWYKNGEIHRDDGPAFISFGHSAWYNNGKLHRTDGPAQEFDSGWEEWWIDGEELSEEEFNNRK